MNAARKMPRLEIARATLQRTNLLQMIELAAKTGFQSISANPLLYRAMLEWGYSPAELRAALDANGITVGYIDGCQSVVPGASPGSNEVVGGEDTFFEVTEGLRSPALNIASAKPIVNTRPQVIDALGGFAQRAAKHGVTLLLEFHPAGCIPNMAAALEIIKAIGAPNVKLMFDNLHFYRSGGVPADMTDAVMPLIGGVQLSDRRKEQDLVPYQPRSTRHLPGDGDLPVVEVTRRLIDKRPDLAIGVEVYNEALRDLPPPETAKRAMDSVRRLLEKAMAPA